MSEAKVQVAVRARPLSQRYITIIVISIVEQIGQFAVHVDTAQPWLRTHLP